MSRSITFGQLVWHFVASVTLTWLVLEKIVGFRIEIDFRFDWMSLVLPVVLSATIIFPAVAKVQKAVVRLSDF